LSSINLLDPNNSFWKNVKLKTYFYKGEDVLMNEQRLLSKDFFTKL